MIKKVLITGATGLIGSELVRQCHAADISVNYLTTSKEKIENTKNYKGYYWNPQKGEIDLQAFDGVTAIINLVGATISERWTKNYKKVILESRIESINLLRDTLLKIDHNIVHFISASGVSIYPNSKTKLYTEENEEVDTTFLGEVVLAWEAAAAQFKNMGMEVSKVRTGVVLAKDEGALPKLVKPIKLGVGAPLGSGEQWISWIHLEDIAGIYLFLLKNQLEGKYNAVAPNPVQNKKMTKMIAAKLDSPLWMPNIPAFALKLLLGEMSVLVLEGQLVSSQKIEQLGYHFKYYNLENALQDLL
ncbi:TIGR01777 family oxidoreductase [Aequorivita vladivostokensis]|uniref:NAD-dependent epimerase n=1 Tax=Aequorivita vladivostokensis TaxID=171194 RepID=A0ABR5DHJ3_9FLAO|nr:TIGR01777 family oxidoreductase [Aequorivita vladivostokensis]MAB57773.1 TIGR01777 family protein [Aequorivita sp.]KJJ38258.1 NAD-dependent epimerase [Aequorivita vladivostokensis]MAO47302.1 TIGR01777 family protein [Aequorivita sp.]MBF29769.1 TIGR01777 family protein [Aequorivita sp.]HAV54713.1 TIGR01777 family protein [Aequorivita sp.]|tara:strand:- start:45162 stop:46070 length:909 start_codon:yes stop_codon:yes gene_type:complete